MEITMNMFKKQSLDKIIYNDLTSMDSVNGQGRKKLSQSPMKNISIKKPLLLLTAISAFILPIEAGYCMEERPAQEKLNNTTILSILREQPRILAIPSFQDKDKPEIILHKDPARPGDERKRQLKAELEKDPLSL
jgi:hypothetical protein